MLPAITWGPGPTSGTRLGQGPFNGVPVPFLDRQPVQGFSGALDNGDGSFLVMTDNGYGALENSADSVLRVYTVRPDFKTQEGGRGGMAVEGGFDLRDPDKHVRFAITNHFTPERILTGADFDIESFQRTPDGTLWFGDEFGPFLLHTDASGKLLESPIPLVDAAHGGELRTPQNPFSEEASAVRVMNALRAHARGHGAFKVPVFSPHYALLNDKNAATGVPNRLAPPAGSRLSPATSDVFEVKSLQTAGYPVVPWTVNDLASMKSVLALGVNGMISDRPDLLLQAVREHVVPGQAQPGGLMDADGLIDGSRFDAQGHRGGRDLRPENTLPAMEVALDHLMTTLELDTGISADGVPMLDHDPSIEAARCRRADKRTYDRGSQVLVKSLTAAQIQSTFICDKVVRGASQLNDPARSPAAAAFAAGRGLRHVYVMPTLQQVFDFVRFYGEYYRTGAGASHPEAARRAKNAERVRFNIETKVNPRARYAANTVEPKAFADAVARVILGNGLADRADMQSFDFRTLLRVHEKYPQLRTVFLFGDFPVYADTSLAGTDDGTNLQPEDTANTPWLAGLYWPYRSTAPDKPFRVLPSGGFESLALGKDGTKLYPMLEKGLVGGEAGSRIIYEFDIASRRYTGVKHLYKMEEKGESIGDFILFDEGRGLALERDGTQGKLDGFKAVYELKFNGDGQQVSKRLAVDLLRIDDTAGIAGAGSPGDVGLGADFAFPFVTIEDVLFFDSTHIGVINDNNFPFSVGRHVGTGAPDDTEFIRIQLDQELGKL
ncbi:esterase-like activity of phytase family protein [Hyalangium rubrum]|uniref:Esterase-like activity of phytase family protein n=1 Tax=Hyalangium rubrum TaxID=3103134 RepID=A0ABU5HH42_9BACT|nr:esterase-like activity of phytase family protein [Hyalangium sp. s54d21]MDY7232772.1 esterase-like activity of phytase family protein [Hyalangium sp. s54d21]